MIRLGLVVEGEGELEAFPLLLRRMLADEHIWNAEVTSPVRLDRGQFRQAHELQRAVRFALAANRREGPVVVLGDADDDCPAKLGPDLRGVAQAVAGSIPVAIVLANREFEAWFLAGAESLRGKRGISLDFSYVEDPEARRNAKSILTKSMHGRVYKPRVDQALAAVIDLAQARRARSFDRCCREVVRVCHEFQKSR